MPSYIDPYTGRLITTPDQPPVAPSAGIDPLLQALMYRGQQERDKVLRDRATELVEETRQSVLGEPSPYLGMKQKVLEEEARASEERGVLGQVGHALTSPFRALSPENIGESMAGPPQRRETPIMDTDEAMAELGLILQPGSAEYKVFADQLAGIKKEAILQKMGPVLEERYGIPAEAANPEGLAYILQTEKVLGPDMQIRERTVPGPGGEPMKQVFWEDQRTGKMVPLTRPAKARTAATGTLVTYDDEGRPIILQGTEAIIAKGMAKEESEDRATFIRQQDHIRALVQGLDRVNDLVQAGQEPTGPLARLASSGRAMAIETTRGLRIAGFPNTATFLEKYDSPAIAETARKNAKLKVLQLSMAAALARTLDPTGRDLSSREVDRALESLAPIFSGDPLASEAASRELVNSLVRAHNVTAQRLQEEPINIEEDAPGLYQLRAPGRVVTPDDAKQLRDRGAALTAAERARVRNALDPRAEYHKILREKGVE